MTFFNKKEEVLDIQLTQYGKNRLSLGKLNPTYYSFFDDDVLYDGEYAGISEDQNSIEGRIQENTPKNKTQYLFSSIQDQFMGYLNQITDPNLSEIDKIRIPPAKESLYALGVPMGTSDLLSSNVPAWKVTFLEGEFDNNTVSGTLEIDNRNINIPQLNINFTNKTKIKDASKVATAPLVASSDTQIPSSVSFGIDSSVFSDGNYIDVIDDKLMILVEESGIPYSRENYEIEVFRIEPDGSYKDFKMMKKQSNVVDNVIVEDEIQQKPVEIDESYVEFFFNIKTDREISKSDICQSITRLKSKGIKVDYDVDCEESLFRPTELSPYLEGYDADGLCDPTKPDDFCE